MKKQNPVAKNMGAFNKAHVFKNRKKAAKQGEQKHKPGRHAVPAFLLPRQRTHSDTATVSTPVARV